MKDRIRRAYDTIAPEEGVQRRIWENIQSQPNTARNGRPGRKMLFLAAAAAVLSCGVWGAYQTWYLPEPQTYEPDPDSGIYSIQTEALYRQEEIPQTQQSQSPGALEDGYFLEQAVQVLEAVGMTDVDISLMRLVRQEHLRYGRQEAEVFFENDQIRTSVKFDASFGHLLSLSSIDWLEDTTPANREAAELAREYYEKLPVAQGYVQMEQVEKYDAQYWSFAFCREIQPGLYSDYEMVRISVNPVSGRLVGCNVFYFPLLDDHDPQQVPVSREEAVALTQTLDQVNLTDYVLESAQVAVVLPNWFFTEYMDGNLQYSQVSRLGWVIRYVKPDSEWGEQYEFWIDYYTGQLLGGDMV